MRSAAGGLLLASLLAGCASTPPAAQAPVADATHAVAPAIWPIDRTLFRTTAGDIYLDNLDGRIEMLRARLLNDGQTEIRVAAGEQAKITELRLRGLG